jgi:iron-sulfur cluster insertion protein|tara:strand:- start:109 stop:429 length:321 start_codon:yes stop_codon:yes gene_type:complete
MIITEKAVHQIRHMASQQKLVDYGLRVMVVGGGCSGFTYNLELDNTANPGDQLFEEKGLTIYVDPMSYQYLSGTTLDYIESFKYSGFHFDNPNASRTCGCGSSFAI